eukprot:g1266.t1
MGLRFAWLYGTLLVAAALAPKDRLPAFGRLLAPTSVDDFLRGPFGTQAVRLQRGSNRSPPFVSAATVWAALYRLFDGGADAGVGVDGFARQLPSGVRAAATRVRVKKMGEELHNATVRSANHARALLASGHSLVVQQAHLVPAIGAALLPLLRDLHAAGFVDVGVNAYLGAPNSSALRPHSDTTDTYILALGTGTKAWRLCVPAPTDADRAGIDASAAAGLRFTDGDLAQLADTRRHRPGGCANYADAEFAAMRRCETIELSGGDALHVPKGVVHRVVVLPGGGADTPNADNPFWAGGAALHLTLSTDRAQSSWAAVLERMLTQTTPRWPPGDSERARRKCRERALGALRGLMRAVEGVPLARAAPVPDVNGLLVAQTRCPEGMQCEAGVRVCEPCPGVATKSGAVVCSGTGVAEAMPDFYCERCAQRPVRLAALQQRHDFVRCRQKEVCITTINATSSLHALKTGTQSDKSKYITMTSLKILITFVFISTPPHRAAM